ncbi:MAG: sn-glycerol-3-phosphate ABC transporter ATP-binding protein UgpC [Moraxellaceae bacterium]|nr:sn-glycerol-3-phosphate ABC transporter ATP-binding protein UgpC [Moraxellaceae bacterium]
MAGLSLRNVRKTYTDGTDVIHGIDLEVQDGEFLVFVGPSGCGKSTLLRMIAGLEDITGGDILIGGERINDVEPSRRGVAMVFQSYALYPHMTVAENMGFALKLAGESRDAIGAAVGRAAEILQISHLLDKRPKTLSGGQRQRVAIGRAIVRKPRVFLFDEPLSNLDAALRVQMRIELARLHGEIGNTMIYVTHDQVEAMTLGDRIALFNAGRIEQVGRPLDLYERPASRFVAGFLGSPRMNFLRCEPAPSASTGSLRLRLGDAGEISLNRPVGAAVPVALGVRPEHISLTRTGDGLRARVELLEHLGDSVIMYASLAGQRDPVAVRLSAHPDGLEPGATVGLLPQAEHVAIFDAAGRAMSSA